MKKIKLILLNILLIALVCTGLYVFVNRIEKEHQVRLETVNRSYNYSRGLITDFKSYKGHSLVVRYKIGSRYFEFSGGWDSNPKRLSEGDSISFRYSVENPRYIITELEKEY
ncbi:hypothetical protein DYBT9275_01201 [Dyadobacter sp. CECT 9275]|uniref:DUF3592 domain-containing protein n=1 Tax=Dyadobacter helix TaxID=2822344 RepID=A0A916JBL4_9BACT|nr:hypothetical protein [Dyadobacter sp. CECT 9275]CAG4993613.1 hypothetical protein DYBT9275_01201 [Dyadobacter sp. CECT 9275]